MNMMLRPLSRFNQNAHSVALPDPHRDGASGAIFGERPTHA
jgi:hypothetical protein